ncbi:Guanine nucleotide exchange protein smcr8 [Chamberlinius hualienensis]
MYGAYADVAAYNRPTWDSVRRSSEDFLHCETLNWLAPEGLNVGSIPGSSQQLYNSGSYHNSTTCSSCNYEVVNNDLTFLDDFILICEVSELEGPKPLVSIPRHSLNNSCVDGNALAEKLMSIDYHCSSKGPFEISQDTQVILSSITEEFHAFSNYFNLYDISARGFVRPICIAYITTNKRKLVDFFDSLRISILSVSRCLKYGNRKQFLQDLHLYHHDLQLAKDNYMTKCLEKTKDVCADDLSKLNTKHPREFSVINQFAENITEAQQLLSIDKPILDDECMANILWKTEIHMKSSFHDDLYPLIKLFIRLEPTHSSKLESIECNAQCLRLHSIFELCSWGIVVGINALITMQKFFKRDFATIYMETEDLKFLNPSKSAVAFGNYVLVNTESPLNDSSFVIIDDILSTKFEKNLTEMQTVFSFLELNLFLNQQKVGSSFCIDDSDFDEFDDAECGSTCTVHTTVHSVSDKSKSDDESYRSVLESPIDKLENLTLVENDCQEENDQKSMDIFSLAKHVEFLSPDKPGFGIANVFARLNNFTDILFSIFIGHQVIIAGCSDDEELVRSVIQAFDILVPDKRTMPVAFPWCSRNTRVKNFDKYKLVGLCVPEITADSLMVEPHSNATDVSVVYVGKNIYMGPIYSGQLLKGLHQISRTEWDDSAFLCYLHSLVLGITTRVILYNNFDKQNSKDSKCSKEDLLADLCIDDISIVENFATIFKEKVT